MDYQDLIDTYPDFSELVSEAVSEPYPIQGKARIARHKKSINALKEALIDGDDAEAGRILRMMVVDQLEDWGGVHAARAEQAEWLEDTQ